MPPSAAPPLPPRPAELAIPTPAVPRASIVALIPLGVAVTYIFPNSGFWIADIDYGPSPSTPPRWTVWLESWYRAFCPALWPLLEGDEIADKKVADEMLEYRRRRWKAGAAADELDGLSTDWQALDKRRLERYVQLYGLHATRQRYLDYCLSGNSPLFSSESAALLAAEAGEARLFSRWPPGRIWPLLVPHDPHPNCRCTAFAASAADVERRFVMSDTPTDESPSPVWRRHTRPGGSEADGAGVDRARFEGQGAEGKVKRERPSGQCGSQRKDVLVSA